ncbi:MAG: formylmethanofuran dehydrogenase subunit E family protein [Promethearchaeota archaeon]
MKEIKERISIDDIEKSLEYLIREFYGHLDPHVILGARMAILSNRLLGDDLFKKHIKVYTGHSPPKSCLVDGIQFFSSCTLGKNNIGILNEGISKAIFTLENTELIIELKAPVNIPKKAASEEIEKI